ncbi:hypothetical protein NPIL_677491 [Nephila pilipes]|uniref:Uncharacterized protein n=1 Tax=Nephila pilipes TaxID=299642 RepID=A0A8X6U111_NEPPI|nr:hypothetical protein NPIL_677491 [Nephila pilipes]
MVYKRVPSRDVCTPTRSHETSDRLERIAPENVDPTRTEPRCPRQVPLRPFGIDPLSQERDPPKVEPIQLQGPRSFGQVRFTVSATDPPSSDHVCRKHLERTPVVFYKFF